MGGITGGWLGWRGYRLAHMAYTVEGQVRYMVETGGTIGAAPADETFSAQYLEAIFGDDPALLAQLSAVIDEGLESEPDLNLGEVAAMIVTHRRDDDDVISQVAAYVVGSFPLGRVNPEFHRDGFFRHQLEEPLWDTGRSALRFVGRDMVLFADEDVKPVNTAIIEGILRGDILPLANSLHEPLHYTAVFPDPRRVVPPRLRHHVQAVVTRGRLKPQAGESEVIVLTRSPRSANYTQSIVSDLRRMAEIALRTKFRGDEREQDWGTQAGVWWAAEMLDTLEMSILEREENIIRLQSQYRRPMVNALLKALERFGRDWQARRLIEEELLDPREADRLMATRSPLHYWSDEHKWGPDWPIAPSPAELDERRRRAEARQALREAEQAEVMAQRQTAAAQRAENWAAELAQRVAAEPEPSERRLAQLEQAQAEAVRARETADAAQAAALEARATATAAQQAAEEAAQLVAAEGF